MPGGSSQRIPIVAHLVVQDARGVNFGSIRLDCQEEWHTCRMDWLGLHFIDCHLIFICLYLATFICILIYCLLHIDYNIISLANGSWWIAIVAESSQFTNLHMQTVKWSSHLGVSKQFVAWFTYVLKNADIQGLTLSNSGTSKAICRKKWLNLCTWKGFFSVRAVKMWKILPLSWF